MKDALKNKIYEEINKNRIWKAKDILQSNVGSMPYDEELYFEYGKILYQLGDYIESGKYFLLTNTDDEKYHNAIKEFLNRYDEQHYFSHFPRKFKKVAVEKYPKNLKNLIEKHPSIQRYVKEYQKYHIEDYQEYKENFIDKIVGVLIGFIVLIMIAIFLLGAGVLIKYLWSLL